MRAYEVACVAYEEQSENLCELYAERVELQRRLAHGSSYATHATSYALIRYACYLQRRLAHGSSYATHATSYALIRYACYLQRRLAHSSSLAAAAALLRVRARTTEMRLAWLRGPHTLRMLPHTPSYATHAT
jgi:hypothetical protein